MIDVEHMRRFYRMARRIFYIAIFVLLADVLTVYFVGTLPLPSSSSDKYYGNPYGETQSKLNALFKERYDRELNLHHIQSDKEDTMSNKGWKIVTPVGLFLQHVFGYPAATTTPLTDSTANSPLYGYQVEPSISHLWGQYAPYFSVPSEISPDVPPNCRITFAQVLSRHGARDPTLGRTMAYHAMVERIKIIASDAGEKFTGKYSWLNDYEYKLGYDQLTLFGQRQMYLSGVKFYDRYADLARGCEVEAGGCKPLFVRSADQDRVVESAVNFTMGYFSAASSDQKRDRTGGKSPKLAGHVDISEKDGMNNTLNHGLCTEFETGKDEKRHTVKTKEFMATFVPAITERLNRELPGTVNLTDIETVMVMDLCPFETVAREHGYPLHDACYMFSRDEWRKYDYLRTIDKYYGQGYGNPLGPTQGVGFVNELLSRMTGDPSYAANDRTCVNHTLDSNPATFPLGDEFKLFADFSHDNDMVSIYSAMGLYNDTKPLDGENAEDPRDNGGWSTSWMVPFGGRMYVEKMRCDDGEEEDEELVRVLVNDRVIKMTTCDADELGRCRLSKWVESLSFAKMGGFWEKCWV